jgi:hypothetical protein
MVGKLLLAAAFGVALLPACAEEQVGRTTTTSGVVVRDDRCARTEASCVRDDDCCSLWCVGGLCERHQP